MLANLKVRGSVFAAVSLLTLAAAPAFAADAIESIPEPVAPMEEAPVSGWGGGYVGAYGNYAFKGQAKEKDIDNRVRTRGIGGGAFAGYNAELGNGVVGGVEGDVGYHNTNGKNAGTEVDGGVGGSLRARLGYEAAPGILPYVTAGGAAQSVKVKDAGGSDRNTHLGWTAGAGVDAKVSENVFVRGEYRYTDLGSKGYTTGTGSRDVDVRDNRVSLGVGMKF